MSVKNRPLYKLSLGVAIFGLVMISSVLITGQTPSRQPVGVPDDWSHHHLVFSNPGTFADAVKNGTLEKWYRITNDPRYQMQQLKRNPLQRQLAAAPDFAARQALVNGPITVSSGSLPGSAPTPQTLRKDWSMYMGSNAEATATGTVSANNASGSPLSSVTINSVALSASPPAQATATGTFSGDPANAQTLVIKNGTPSITLTASVGTASTQNGSFGSLPTEATANAGDSITMAKGGNTLSVTTNASGASLGGTWTNDPTNSQTAPYVTISGVKTTLSLASGAVLPSATATLSGVPGSGGTVTIASGIQTMTLTATTPGTNAGTIQVNTATPSATDTLTLTTAAFGTVTYTFSTTSCGTTANCIYAPTTGGNTALNMARNIRAAINATTSQCGDPSGSGCIGTNTVVNPYVTAAAPATCNTTDACITLNNSSYQAVTLGKTGTSGDFTLTSLTGFTTSGCSTDTATTTTGTFIIGTGALGTAENLYGAINACNTTYPVIGTTASSFNSTSDSFTVSETVYGTTSSGFGGTATSFAWSTQAGNVGSGNSCSGSGSAYTASYQAANSAATLMSNVVAALQACPAATGNIYALAGTAPAFTVYNNTLGTATTTISAESAGTPSLVTWGTLTAGSTGSNTCNTTTAATFQVLSTDTTTTLIATELAAALNLCSTANDATIGIATGASAPHTTSSGAQITITANQWVAAASSGITLGYTSGGPFSWSSASMTGGSSGSGTAPNFAVDNIPSDIASNLAADINTSGEGSSVGVSASTGGAGVTLTATTAGTGGNSIGVTNNMSSSFSLPTANLSGGSDGTASGTTWPYWSVNAAVSTTQLASNIATAINANGTLNGEVLATAFDNTIAVNAKTAGAGGDYTTAVANFAGFTWSGGLSGGGNTPTVGAGNYPAKYSFSTGSPSTANCDSAATPDFVVYNTTVGGTSTQASIIAYDNLYATTCVGTVPLVYWQYNTGGVVTNNPVLSGDGHQVAFMQTGAPASLVLLRWSKSSTLAEPTVETAANYPGCTAPCMTVIPFATVTNNDTNSSPFYDYSHDVLYVGDDNGQLHKFSPVFNGTPAEITSSWPINVSSNVLTSPVVDYGTANGGSGNIFVADSGGFLYSYKVSTAAHVMTSSQLTATGSTGIVDAPLVDSSTEMVYVFVGNDATTSSTGSYNCNYASGCSGVFQFSATNSTIPGSTILCNATTTPTWPANSNCGNESVMGTGNTSTRIYDGTFDNIYYSGTGNTGNLWVCAANSTPEPKLVYQEMSSFPTIQGRSTAVNVVNPLTSAAATCSPVTEIYNTSGTATDYIFFSVTNSSNPSTTGCATGNACVYSYNVTSAPAFGCTLPCLTPTGGFLSTGGSSGIIIDNILSATGTSQIYFSNLGSQACSGVDSGGGGTGTGGCAVQVSQSAP